MHCVNNPIRIYRTHQLFALIFIIVEQTLLVANKWQYLKCLPLLFAKPHSASLNPFQVSVPFLNPLRTVLMFSMGYKIGTPA